MGSEVKGVMCQVSGSRQKDDNQSKKYELPSTITESRYTNDDTRTMISHVRFPIYE